MQYAICNMQHERGERKKYEMEEGGAEGYAEGWEPCCFSQLKVPGAHARPPRQPTTNDPRPPTPLPFTDETDCSLLT